MRKILGLQVLGLAFAGGFAPARADLLSAEQLNTAHKLYVVKCAKCHRMYDPAKYSDSQWQAWMVKMNPKAKLKPDQRELLESYIEQTLRHPQPATPASPP